jgi:uncharacterized protein
MATFFSAPGVGIGFRPELARDLLSHQEQIDFIEIVAETCFTQHEQLQEAEALRAIWPVVPHGVKLSLGSADGIDEGRAKQLGQLAQRLHSPCITEHAAFTRSGSYDIGHLTQLPRTSLAARTLGRNVARARKFFPDIPLLLENVAWTVRFPEDEMLEGEFYTEVVQYTNCDLLLDLSNLYANALNEGHQPIHVLEQYPLDRVKMVHIAGGVWESQFYFDNHAARVPEGVFKLLAALFQYIKPVPIILERDGSFPAFSELLTELEQAQRMQRPKKGPPLPPPSGRTLPFRGQIETLESEQERRELEGLRIHQNELALWLSTNQELPNDACERHGKHQLELARSVLLRKRVDDALPLLRQLSSIRNDFYDFAFDVIKQTPRPPSKVAIVDAFQLALAAQKEDSWQEMAAIDYHMLRARFVFEIASSYVEPRSFPYVHRLPKKNGKTLWIYKGFGTQALVYLRER